jgi:hypothetical protein
MELDKFNELITNELKRQIEILVGYDSSLDTKLGIFLGFIFLVFIQIIALGVIVSKLSGWELVAYAGAVVVLFVSILIGIVAYVMRGKEGYTIGPSITGLLDLYEDDTERDFLQIVRKATLESFLLTLKTTERKAKWTRYMIYVFLVGLGAVTLLSLWGIYNMVV